MQVSETHDYVNHAIIGGGGPIEMGMSTSAEFFNILSKTLYRDQILAMVRETLCNAWDAHIDANCTDIPIIVTVDNEHLIIKDSGKGIHHEDIGPIYGVYGNSTKKNDGKQTGGFGLGCKSPFAYTDHFEVISCHDGVKTIYQLSQAAVQTEGKPAIIPIASFPTTETGLTVKIDIKSGDSFRIKDLVGKIAFNGEMLVELNGVKCNRLGFDSAVRNYLIYRADLDLLNTDHPIAIRYGNVIYPVETTEVAKSASQIKQFLNKLEGSDAWDVSKKYRILFQAPPHGLSVTPSRESLSMQEHTIKTLEKLFTSFLDQVKTEFETQCDIVAQEMIEQAITNKDWMALLRRDQKLPLANNNRERAKRLVDFKDMAKQYLDQTYPKDVNFRKADRKCRTMLMIEAGMIDKRMGESFIRAIDTVKELEEDTWWKSSKATSDWIIDAVVRPVMRKMLRDPAMRLDNLYLVDENNPHRGDKRSSNIVSIRQASLRHVYDGAVYLRNIIVLSRKKADLHNRCAGHPIFKSMAPHLTGFLFYHVGSKMEDAQKARDFWARSGLNVVDMIDRQTWEPEPERKYISKAAREVNPVRKRGLVKISELLDCGVLRLERWNQGEYDRLTEPEYIVQIPTGETRYNRELSFLNARLSARFAELYGDRGAIVTSNDQYERYLKKGAERFLDFFTEVVIDYVEAHFKEISYWWSMQIDRSGFLFHQNEYSFLEFILETKALQKHFQLDHSFDKTDLIHAEFLQLLLDKFSDEILGPDYKALRKKLATCGMAPELLHVVQKIKDNPCLKVLDVGYAKYRLNGPDNKTQQKIIDLVTTVLG